MSANKSYNWLAVFSLFIVFLIIQSCNKNENDFVSYQYGIETSQQFVYAQQMMTQLMATYFKAINDSVLFADKKAEIDGATVYLILDELPDRLRIEYPWWGNSDGYGHFRQGTYEAWSDNGYHQNGATIDFVFLGFKWDKDSLSIDSLRLVNLGKTDGKNPQYSIHSPKISLFYADTTVENPYVFNMDQTFTLMKESGTIYTSVKDSLSIYGNLNGILPSELEFNAQCFSDSSMLFSFSCDWLKNGTIQVETLNFPYQSMIYLPEPDTCENRYLIEIDGNPFPYPFDL